MPHINCLNVGTVHVHVCYCSLVLNHQIIQIDLNMYMYMYLHITVIVGLFNYTMLHSSVLLNVRIHLYIAEGVD